MAIYFGYFLLGAGVILFLITWFDKSRKSLHLMFIATMMIMAGLAILQFLGTEAPTYLQAAAFGQKQPSGYTLSAVKM